MREKKIIIIVTNLGLDDEVGYCYFQLKGVIAQSHSKEGLMKVQINECGTWGFQIIAGRRVPKHGKTLYLKLKMFKVKFKR